MSEEKDNFVNVDSAIETVWRSIIVLGRNVASYKYTLAKSLLEIDTNKTKIKLDDLAVPFSKNICSHLEHNDKQITSSSSSFIEICRSFNRSEITEEELTDKTVKLGFVNVIDAFHNLAGGETLRFFSDNRSNDNSIILTDNFYNLKEKDNFNNLLCETESRWNLWETAISEKVNPSVLEMRNDHITGELYYEKNKERRKSITSCRGVLNGYQKGKCFYCSKPISIKSGNDDTCHVDHFFPYKLKDLGYNQVDQIWNYVLSCSNCNNGENGKFMKIPKKKFLYSLERRNNWFIESPHNLREYLIHQTGKNKIQRRSFLNNFYDNIAYANIPITWEPLERFGDYL